MFTLIRLANAIQTQKSVEPETFAVQTLRVCSRVEIGSVIDIHSTCINHLADYIGIKHGAISGNADDAGSLYLTGSSDVAGEHIDRRSTEHPYRIVLGGIRNGIILRLVSG